jgi:hypothetical protein
LRTAPTYLGRKSLQALLFAPFFLLTLPAVRTGAPFAFALVQILAISHFLVTFALYFQPGNWRYFLSSLGNRAIYVAIPLALCAYVLVAPDFSPIWIFAIAPLAVLDTFHVAGQSYGVLELLKRNSDSFGAWTRPVCRALFWSFALLELHTMYRQGGFVSDPFFWLVAPIAGVLFLAALFGVRFQASGVPLAYLCLQAACASLAIYRTEFYMLALAGHYLEYQIVIMPRCFYSSSSGLWKTLRERKILFYAPLVAIATVFAALAPIGGQNASIPRWLTAVFIWHYFVEAFLWKFGNAYYKRTALPLYSRPWREVSA